MTPASWREVLAVNLDGLWFCSQVVGRSMVERRQGVIVNIGSISGIIVNRPQWQPAYNASKAAVHQLSRSLAGEWAAFGIRVNALALGYVCTDMSPVPEERGSPSKMGRRRTYATYGNARRSGPRRGLPGQRGVQLRHGEHPGPRRRVHRLVNREGLSPSRALRPVVGAAGRVVGRLGWARWGRGSRRAGRTGHFEPVVLSLPPDLRSVGQARSRLAAAAAEWGCPEHLVDDARVVLSELMSNGVLHARTDLQVVMSAHGAGIRLEVRDASQTAPLPPLDVPRATASLMDEPHQAYLRDEERTLPTATGRGLAVVGALASSWGWYPEPGGGKVVWAELGTEPGAEGAAAHRSPDRVVYPVRPVRLVAAPLRLIKASEDHFDDLARELQMANLAAMAGADGAAEGRPPGRGAWSSASCRRWRST